MTTTSQPTAQDAAEVFWFIATQDDARISAYDSPVYVAAEKAFLSAVRREFSVSPAVARRVRRYLGEYGPHDSLSGNGFGIASYVQYALRHPRD